MKNFGRIWSIQNLSEGVSFRDNGENGPIFESDKDSVIDAVKHFTFSIRSKVQFITFKNMAVGDWAPWFQLKLCPEHSFVEFMSERDKKISIKIK